MRDSCNSSFDLKRFINGCLLSQLYLIHCDMANTRVFFSDLKSGGKCSSVVEARLLRYWEARNVKRGGDLMWVDMLMIDVNATIMQATIYANRLPRFRSKLLAGKMFLWI
ncbi:hypothetical protein F2Q68_00037027 [Brassica cretica]|uniref:Uncharacterized protein n=1 Tax=Brassica cretica TaxID=69181 RepID=A0A8S9H3U1_BRACR|nr:hypothetical protein F2Q68_00037027 [Brassica cretica]